MIGFSISYSDDLRCTWALTRTLALTARGELQISVFDLSLIKSSQQITVHLGPTCIQFMCPYVPVLRFLFFFFSFCPPASCSSIPHLTLCPPCCLKQPLQKCELMMAAELKTKLLNKQEKEICYEALRCRDDTCIVVHLYASQLPVWYWLFMKEKDGIKAACIDLYWVEHNIRL